MRSRSRLARRWAWLIDPGLPEMGSGSRRHLQSLQGHAVQLRHLDKLPRSELLAVWTTPSPLEPGAQEGLLLHWDGNNSSVDERNLSAALGAGVVPLSPPTTHRSSAFETGSGQLPPPAYPYSVDAALAAQGETLYQQTCLSCHGDHRFRKGERSGEFLGKVTPLLEIATDPRRLHAYTQEFAVNQYTLYADSRYRFRHFRKTGAMRTVRSTASGCRALYLHNGSVRDAARNLARTRPASVRKLFLSRRRCLRSSKVGFKTERATDGSTRFFAFDTSLPGNQNSGHEYGTALTDAQKNALVEYTPKHSNERVGPT